MARDFESDCERLLATPNDHSLIRSYQKEANAATENAIAERKRSMLLAIATSTGKTFTLVNEIYRLMKSGVAKRVLFLVDRLPGFRSSHGAGPIALRRSSRPKLSASRRLCLFRFLRGLDCDNA
jgi:hypothetical protein